MRQFKAFFISDLHISKNTPKIILLLHNFVENILAPGDSLYILGDFFEYWLGEDLLDSVQQDILLKLKCLRERDISVYFMQGNRDFLLKETTLQRYHIKMLNDPSLIEIHGQKILLSHGDALCTQDLAYQRYRKLVRQAWIQWLFLRLPKAQRRKIAANIHARNPHGILAHNSNYKLADVTLDAVNQLLSLYQPDLLIYGHVHKLEKREYNKTLCFVLGDWHDTGNYVEISEKSAYAKIFSLNDQVHPDLF